MSVNRLIQRSQRMLGVLTLTLMFAGMILPIVPASAFSPDVAADIAAPGSSQEQLVPIDATEVPIDATEVPVATEAPLPPEQPKEVPEEDSEEVPADAPVEIEAAPLATINLSLRWCPTGTASTLDAPTLKSLCTSQGPEVTASVTSENGVGGPFVATVTSFPNSLSWPNLPLDTWDIRVQTASLQGEAMFCEGITPHGNTKPYGTYSLIAGSYPLATEAEELINCDWFGVLAPGTSDAPVGQGDVEVYKFECPEAAPADATYTWFSTNCTTVQNGVTFKLVGALDDGGDVQTATGDSVPGAVVMGGVKTGTFPLTETVPDGFAPAAVFCTTVNIGINPDPTTFQPQALNGNSIEATVIANAKLSCAWYNVPSSISITIYKWDCPIGTMLNEQQPYYGTECATEMPGVPFSITDANGTQQTTSDTNGRQIDNLVPNASNKINLKETIPAGYGTPMVFCQGLNEDAAAALVVTTGSVNVPMPVPSDDIHCNWYNIPDDGTSVTIYKWECPVGTLTGQASSYYSAECATEQPGVPFDVTDTVGTQQTTSDNNGRQIDGLMGQITITEQVPAGFGTPAIFCSALNAQPGEEIAGTLDSVTLPPLYDDDYHCWFYNIPDQPNTVTVYKWLCPEGVEPVNTAEWHQTNCTTPQDGVEFTITDGIGPRSKTTAGGTTGWSDVETGPFTLKETVPSGYIPATIVVCELKVADSPVGGPTTYTAVNGTINGMFTQGGSLIICHFYNYKVGPSDITVYKFMCPPGYDRTAYGADPYVDCTKTVDAIKFKLDQPDPGVDLFSSTGDSVPSAVYFGSLTPGSYSITEVLEGEGIAETFVWECTGLYSSAVHPKPLATGLTLNIELMGGETVVCNWFNVPPNPLGWIEVTKFNCTTEKWVGDVYCYTNQTGQKFELQMWNGSTWVAISSGTTNAAGQYGFLSLEPGDYRLVEPGKTACLMKSSSITPGGNIGVARGELTKVYVYNCAVPYVPPKTPTKYPNTGTAPAARDSDVRLPMAELASLITLAGMTINRRKLALGIAGLGLGGFKLATAQDLVPMEATAPPSTPGATRELCATPSAATAEVLGPEGESTCGRGAVPVRIGIPTIAVDAKVEYLEIIDGAMQAPSNEADVTWYKETSRLGEVGNGIYAGHLNYWGVPEGVFFRLESLAEGSPIELTGDDGTTYTYLVEWTENFPSDEEPPAEALGATDEMAITLITCGGEWITERSEYDHRTLVRAVMQMQ